MCWGFARFIIPSSKPNKQIKSKLGEFPCHTELLFHYVPLTMRNDQNFFRLTLDDKVWLKINQHENPRENFEISAWAWFAGDVSNILRIIECKLSRNAKRDFSSRSFMQIAGILLTTLRLRRTWLICGWKLSETSNANLMQSDGIRSGIPIPLLRSQFNFDVNQMNCWQWEENLTAETFLRRELAFPSTFRRRLILAGTVVAALR